MNKKFSTLMAGLLLAGGVLSSANAAISATAQAAADELTANEQWVVDYGKYFVLERLNFHDKSTGSWSANADYYLTMDNNGQLVYTNIPSFEDKDAYWTIEDVTTTNDPQITSQYVAKVKVVNANGWTLAFDKSSVSADGHLRMATDATTAANRIDEFYVEKGQTAYNGLLCLWVGGQKYLLGNGTQIATGIYEAVAVNDAASTGTINDVNAVGINEEAISAKDLNAEWNGGFYLNFSSKGKEYKNLTGAEPFAGKLKAEGINGNGTDTQFYLRTASGNYVILSDDYIGDADATLNGTKSAFYRGYNFKTISEHAFAQLNSDELTRAQFSIFKSYDFNKDNIRTDSLIVSLPNVKAIGSVPNRGLNMSAANNESGLRLFVSTVNVAGVTSNMLTTIDYTKCNDMLADIKDNAYVTAQMGALAPCIKLGASNMIDMTAFVGKVWNITDKDGNVLSPKYDVADIDSYAELFAPANQVDLTNPEGQWLLYKDNYGYYYFVNRESGQKAFDDDFTIRTTDTKDMYKLYWDKYTSGATYTIYIKEAQNAELGKTENGYVNFDMAQEDNNGKYLSFETSLGVTAYIGKDADDNVILTDDANKAIEFRVKQLSHDFRDHDGIAAPDTLHHYTSFLNYNSKKEIIQDVDTLQFFHYVLYENFSEKYLMYDKETKKFKLSDESYTLNAHERFDQEKANCAFVVKEKEDGSYILVREYAIDYDFCNANSGHSVGTNWDNNDYTFDNVFEVNFGDNAYDQNEDYNVSRSDGDANGNAHKAYAASQPGTLADMASLYNYNDNDRITMENTDKVEYLKITGSQDTVKISLKAQPNFFLYEDGTFLGMEHVADVEDMKPAMFVDTAYVRNNTYRPQYLLAMNGKYVEEVYDNAGHLLEPDTTYGRFLINAVDSAEAWTGTVKTNPYIHEQLGNNYYYRLVFVDGYHTGDKLFLNTAKAKTTIDLSNNNDKVCTFAFRYVDESREGVKIETAYGPADANGNRSRGWLKYQNNVPVVTPDYEDAHVFTVDNTTTDAPTANETIAAGKVVVAGTNGAVVVKGAEGKNVIVSTILGKVVANEVVSSDNAQIATPAGIVVVSVDGESFKVVVK